MRWFKIITWPIAVFYALVVYIRNFLYDLGFLRSETFSTPTICIGNLSVGGTGKTPMIDFLLTNLKPAYKIAVLSRGYKRKSRGFQLANKNATAKILGDEPYQLYKNHPKVSLAVDADRRNGISNLEALDTFDFILLDDAFQHRKVKPSFSILLTTFDNPYPKDFYIPVGSLRDAKNQAKRANVIVVTKCPVHISDIEKQTLRNLIRPKANQSLLFTSLSYETSFTNGQNQLRFQELKGRKIALVTGIAKPENLVNYLQERNIVFEHIKFNDHHFFSKKELMRFSKYDLVLTTEKDYARLEGKLDYVYYLKVSHEFFQNDKKELLSNLTNALKFH